jgi:hypothetical protein
MVISIDSEKSVFGVGVDDLECVEDNGMLHFYLSLLSFPIHSSLSVLTIIRTSSAASSSNVAGLLILAQWIATGRNF